MVILEDKEIEKALFENCEEVIVPIEVTKRDKKVEIITLEKTKDIANEFEKRFIKSPFSKEAKMFLHSSLNDVVKAWGYQGNDIDEGHILTYVDKEVNQSLILPTTKRIKGKGKYENLTEHELEKIPRNSNECYFVTIIDNKIVSVCEMNTAGAFIGATEINVYTAPHYRKNGYGASNVCAMANYLINQGKRVAYTVNYKNKPSEKLAIKCGFKKLAETFYYITYREE
ncbi:MAG: GNAT family N-acetyltransferase [Clostridia bacterium]|nr:GNAT family N-acetyltransferase [Clostridia bacterium]